MTDWAGTWQAWRFNTHHGAAGSGHGGQFVSAGGQGGGKATGTGPKGTGHTAAVHAAAAAPAHPRGDQAARRRQIVQKIHADEAQIRQLEHQLHLQRQALKTAASAAAHHKAQAAKAKKAGHVVKHRRHTARHHVHHHASLSHRARITQIQHQIGVLRAQVKSLRAQAARL